MPRIFSKSWADSSGVLANFTPPPLPRPPAWIWALTTLRPPYSWVMLRASAASPATRPSGVATLNCLSSSLAWYSWMSIKRLLGMNGLDGRGRS